MTWNVAGGNCAGPLKYKRGIATRRDLGSGALAERSEIVDPRRTGKGWASSLDDLRTCLAQYGNIAVFEARLSAMRRWLLEPGCKPSDPFPVVHEAMSLIREKAFARAGLPFPSGPITPIMDKLDAVLQREAYDVGARVRRDWRRARRPHLDTALVRDTHMFITACIRVIPAETMH